MEAIKYVNVNYFGKKIKIENTNSYSGFKNSIKEQIQLSKEECKQLKFKFIFGNNDMEIDVNNRDEYKTAYQISQQFDKINVIIINPKPKTENKLNLDDIISKLKQEKKELIKQYNQIKKKNKDLMKELNNESKESNQEIINRISMIEKTEQTYSKQVKNKQKIMKDIPENIKIKNKVQKKFDCLFLNNNNIQNHTIKIKINKINKHAQIKYSFKVNNNGREEWPDDTFLKCETNDTPIFFYYSTIKDNEGKYRMDNDIGLIQEIEIIVVFKNYSNIKVGEYELKAYLISDKYGRIGNNYGILNLKVLPSDYDEYNSDMLNYLNNDYKNDFHQDY